MKPITNGKKPFLAVPIPKDAFNLIVKNGVLFWTEKFDGENYNSFDTLSFTDNLTLLGKLSELTEEQAEELVPSEKVCVYEKKIGTYYKIRNNLYKCVFIALRLLLQSNDCWLKEWIVAPNFTNCCYGQSSYDNEYKHEVDEYNQKLSQASEDFLIILID